MCASTYGQTYLRLNQSKYFGSASITMGNEIINISSDSFAFIVENSSFTLRAFAVHFLNGFSSFGKRRDS